jgi:pilus assembly protein CpaC
VGLALCLTLAGVPGDFAPGTPYGFLSVRDAAAADSGVIRIAQGGAGTKRRLALGLNKALVMICRPMPMTFWSPTRRWPMP